MISTGLSSAIIHSAQHCFSGVFLAFWRWYFLQDERSLVKSSDSKWGFLWTCVSECVGIALSQRSFEHILASDRWKHTQWRLYDRPGNYWARRWCAQRLMTV